MTHCYRHCFVPDATFSPVDTMARITIDDCLEKIPNRFELTLAATNRARQLSAGSTPLLDADRDKSTVIALREIAAGRVGIELLLKGQS